MKMPVTAPLVRAIRPFQEFAARETSGGILLLLCTLAALTWANSPWALSYEALLHIPITLGAGEYVLRHDLHFWINDALMAVFFFVVGLEIKREFLVGELSEPRQAALPIIAALGGVVVPAVIYLAFNARGPGIAGWGIPMATDIAFVLGVMALLGDRVPLGLKVFLTALAIVDDIAAVLVIALFYTAKIDWTAFSFAAGLLCLLALANRAGLQHPLPYAVAGCALWVAVAQSGVHATIAGILLASTIPSRASHGRALLDRFERAVHPWVTFLIVPVFALVNAGVDLRGSVGGLSHPVMLGVTLGLLLGKPTGIVLASWLAVRSNLASLPTGVSWQHIHGAGWLGGIGFTMSLFVAALAFSDELLLTIAKAGILAGSAAASIIGSSLLLSHSVKQPR